MSRGKFSPFLKEVSDYIYNAKGEVPAPAEWSYNPETMFEGYDKEGYDVYGYSAYDSEGKYVGNGEGVDRAGYTEYEYLCMTDGEWYSVLYVSGRERQIKGGKVTIESIYDKVRSGVLSLDSFKALVSLN